MACDKKLPRLIPDFRMRKSQALRQARAAVLSSLSAVDAAAEPWPLVVVGVSGGRDSLALLEVTIVAARELKWRVAAVCVDHQMQPGSAQVAENTRRVALASGAQSAEIITVDVDVREGGPEAAARSARYRALASYAKRCNARAVLLAHTQDDQAETVLLGLLRSSGPDALVGMPPSFTRHDVTFLRPLLCITREQTTQICEACGIEWWDDPTNGDGKQQQDELPLRSQVRQKLIPLMKQLGGNAVSEHLASVAQHAQALRASLESRVEELERMHVRESQRADNLGGKIEKRIEVDSVALVNDEVLGSRLVMRLFERLGVPANREKVRQVVNLASKPTLNKTLQLRAKNGEVVSITREKKLRCASDDARHTTSSHTDTVLRFETEFHRNPTFC